MFRSILVFLLLAGSLSGCAYFYAKPPAVVEESASASPIQYQIGSGDQLQVFVWRNPDLTVTVPVRPDGRISVPLLGDVQASGKTATQLAADISKALGQYVREPQVTVIVQSTVGRTESNIRILGEALQPKVVPFFAGMTLLDAIADAGGLTEFADGNRAYLIRTVNGHRKKFHLRIASLVKSGDMGANIQLAPNDT
ncbi:MAG: XrtA/PEP-CTERM system exopolysaccharide export protein, partial [Alphaproteobacteria bacterium]